MPYLCACGTFFAWHKCAAEDTFMTYGAFCGASDQTLMMSRTPVRMMDDDQLYLSAQYMRSSEMSAEQRLINYYWLRQNENNTIRGGKALAKVLRFSLLTYIRNDRSDQFGNASVFEDDEDVLERHLFNSQWGEYKLGFSGSKVSLNMHLEFH